MTLHGRTLVFVFVLAAARALSAHAEPPAAGAGDRREAAARFDRGLHLFNQGDNAGALVEFRRAYDLTGDAVILLNVGLVYAEMKRPLDAVETLDRLLAAQVQLTPERRETARRVRAEQWALVAFLVVTADAPAVIAVDDVEVARTPLTGPLRIASGSHVVSAVATGYAPSRRQIEIAGGETQTLSFALVRSEASLAHVGIRSLLPGADVLVDGRVVGRTPLPMTLAVAPGSHRFELKRPGYRTAAQVLTIDQGATAEIDLEADLDPAAIAAIGGALIVRASEPGASFAIDGRPTEVSTGPLRLPPGLHRVTVSRSGFVETGRDVAIQQGATTTMSVVLEPTADTKEAYVSRVKTRRVWSLGVAAAGVVAAAAGAVLIVTGRPALADANRSFSALETEFVRGSGQACDPAIDRDMAACDARWNAANDRVSHAELRLTIGYAAAGIGALAAGVGVVLLLTGEDPGRYDRPRSPPPMVTGWAATSGGGLTIQGHF